VLLVEGAVSCTRYVEAMREGKNGAKDSVALHVYLHCACVVASDVVAGKLGPRTRDR